MKSRMRHPNVFPTLVGSFCLCVWSFLGAGSLSGQDYDRVAPKPLPSAEGPEDLPKLPEPGTGSDDTPLVDRLQGLVFVGKSADVRRGPVERFEGICIENIPLIEGPAFRARMEPFLGKPVSFRNLNAIVREVIEYCRDNDRPVVFVVVPEQDITSGVVQVVVIEGKVGEVRAAGNKWFSADSITGRVRCGPGDPISHEKLLVDLHWLNANPFREVDLVFQPGREEGRTDLVLETRDRFPARFYTGFEDTGNDLTGDDRLLAGFNCVNPLFPDHLIGYQFTTDEQIERMVAQAASPPAKMVLLMP